LQVLTGSTWAFAAGKESGEKDKHNGGGHDKLQGKPAASENQ